MKATFSGCANIQPAVHSGTLVSKIPSQQHWWSQSENVSPFAQNTAAPPPNNSPSSARLYFLWDVLYVLQLKLSWPLLKWKILYLVSLMPSSIYLLWLAKSKSQVVYKIYLMPQRAKDESTINGNPLLQCVRSLTRGLSSLNWDGKQRHLVYLKKASTFISHSRAAWLYPWLWSVRHIFLPTGDCPFAWHSTKPAGLKLQHHSIQFVSEKRTNKQWVRCKHRWCIT